MCSKKWHYIKTAASINCETVPNSEGAANENSLSNKFCENSKILKGLIAILVL
jgi:hypothetical protein